MSPTSVLSSPLTPAHSPLQLERERAAAADTAGSVHDGLRSARSTLKAAERELARLAARVADLEKQKKARTH